MRQLALATATAAAVAATAFPIAASAAVAAGPQSPSCGTYTLKKDEWIDNRLFRKGTYRLHAKGISCAKVIGNSGVFAQFVRLSDTAPLPQPWKSLAKAVGAPKFAAGPGIGFRAQRISG